MGFTLKYDGSTDQVPFKTIYSGTLKKLFAQNPNVVAGEADIGNGMWAPDYHWMKATYGDRFFDVGIQEADLVGIAAGMAVTGKIPYIHTFAPFMTRRTYDSIFLSGAYAKLNIRLIGSDPGITAAYNGGTHMAFEDVGLMRNIPGCTIVDCTDGAMLKDVLEQTEHAYGIFYFRFPRGAQPITVYGEGSSFQFGKGNLLRDGKDVTIIAAGILVAEALKAAETLENQGISARVVDIFTIKPLDEELVLRCAKETGAIVTAENHSVLNGLGAAVARTLALNGPLSCALSMIGSQDEFGEVGPQSYLAQRFGMTAENIVENALEVIRRKGASL